MSSRGWTALRRVFRLPPTRRRVRSDVSRELEFHIEGRIEELVAQGYGRADAEREARRRFGDFARIESEVERLALHAHRRQTLAEQLGALGTDLRYSIRTLVRQPVYTAVVLVTLTLGIAATTAIFHVVERVVLRPLPYPDPERIAYLGWRWASGASASLLSAGKLVFWREHNRVFEGIGTSKPFQAAIGDQQPAVLARGLRVTADFLRVVGIAPAIGRLFAPDEFTPGPPRVAILGHSLWTTQFGADSTIVGQQIKVDGRPLTVIGVMPASFVIAEAPGSTQVITPFAITAEQLADGGNTYVVVARLRPNVTQPQIAADMAAVLARYREAFPDRAMKDDVGIDVSTYQQLFLGDLPSSLYLMLGATAFVLVLACANVANLLFARSLGRQREFAVRTALGAGRARIARHVVLEMFVLGGVSAVLATAVSLVSMRSIVALADGWLLREDQLRIDPRVVAYTALITIAASLAIGLLVSLAATRVDLARALADGGRGASAGRRQRFFRGTLVSTESAMAMLLLAGAGLLIASFARVAAVDPGFRRDGVFTATLTYAPRIYDSASAIARFERQVLERLRHTPGIVSAASASSLPLRGGWNLPMTVEGRPDASEPAMEWRAASGDFFGTFGVRPLNGRVILDSDEASAPPVVVISQSFARKYWPGESPIGRRLLLGRSNGRLFGPRFDDPPREIVGVVPDLLDTRLDQRRMRNTAWIPRAQVPPGMLFLPSFAVRATDATLAATALRSAVADAEPRMGVPTISSMNDVASASLANRRFAVVLMSVFALVALVLTCVGIYGAVAYSVAQRTQEIGIRMALGARPRGVIALVVGQGVRPALIGLVVGLAASLALSRLLTRMLYQVGPRDPLPLAAVTVLLVGVALVASYLPARRAAKIDPLTALRA